MGRPIRKVLFIEPRAPQPHIFSRVVIPRLGSVLLGTILAQQGREVKVVVEEINEPRYENLDFAPDLVCISTITSTTPRAHQLADFYRQRGIPVAVGGPHPSFVPDQSLEHADFVVCGEGDEALPELVAALEQGGGYEGIGSLCYWEGGEKRYNPRRPMLADLDTVPIPDYGLIHGWRSGKQQVLSIATSRGCPFGCRFCSVIQMFGRQFRFNSEDRVIEEFRVNGSQANHVFICDDNFTANRERVKHLMERMLSLGIKMEWSAQVRVDAARDPELLKLMARSGCFMVFIGLESINPATLKAYKKSQTVEDVQESVITFHQHGIRVHGMFVFGSEEDTVKTIRDTVSFSRKIDLDSLQYLILTPIPGTPVYDELEAQDRFICRDWAKYDGHHAVYVPKRMTPYELQIETLQAMKRFYTWGSAFKRLLQRDWFFGFLKIHGRLHLKRSFEGKLGYFNHLKGQLYSLARVWRERGLGKKRIRRVGIPEDIWQLSAWEAGPREFLLRFLERLGVEIVREGLEKEAEPEAVADGGQIQRLFAEINHLQEKTDMILIPFWLGLENVRQRARDLHQEVSQKLVSVRQMLTLDFDRSSFYYACMQLGLVFKASPRFIRRIYRQTQGELEAMM